MATCIDMGTCWSDLVYLASPYTSVKHTGLTAEIEQAGRFEEVSRMAGHLMAKGLKVFCPIAHSHPIALYSKLPPTDGDFWINQDLAVLQHCKRLLVYKMPGWEESRGVKMEIEFAERNNIPVEYLEY